MKDKHGILLKTVEQYVGIHRGTPEGQQIIAKWLHEIGLPLKNKQSKYVPYCAAFTISCLKECNIPNQIYRAGLVLEIWNKTPIELRTENPFPGCLFVWDCGGGRGHIGFIEKLLPNNRMLTIEGNSKNPDVVSDDSERDGGWVIKRDRSSIIGTHGEVSLIGFIDPFG